MNGLPAPSPAAPALDFAAGLERMLGDQPMYLRVLARFRSDYADNVARLRAALDAGDTPLAQRIAHTLKGAAAMIEARGLRALAVAAELDLRAGAGPLAIDPQVLDRLEAELARVVAQVDSLLAAPPINGAGLAAGAPAVTDSDIAQLCALLDLGDSAAQDVVMEKHAGLRTRLGAPRMAQLESAVAAFDFERALTVLAANQQPPASQAAQA